MTISALGIISSIRRGDAHRTFVRAAFNSGGIAVRGHGQAVTTIGGPLAFTNLPTTATIRQLGGVNNDFILCASASQREPFSSSSSSSSARAMSTASETETDYELESALEEILGEAIRDAENPVVDAEVGGRGHIEGSRAFPKELIEEVCF
jgi:hypothetical protein